MKFKSAIFTAVDVPGCAGDVRIVFQKDDAGKPLEVKVHLPGGNVETFGNHRGGYKPCETHCKDLIRQALGNPPPNNFASRRKEEERKAKPALKVHK